VNIASIYKLYVQVLLMPRTEYLERDSIAKS